ncbi:MAG: ABC transporter permease [Candidatus Bathyarchaeia archaeon]
MNAPEHPAGKVRQSWLTRFWAVVRYEMLWNIRKKKFLGVIIVAFILATLGFALPPILSSATGQPITLNPEYAVTYSTPAIGLFLFALVTAMNSISSEFESGTIVPLLTKPVSRTMVFLGKLLATFIIILATYAVLYVYMVIGSTVVYGGQNNLQLVPLGLLGNVVSTFIWVALILAVGALSKNTIVSAVVAFGFFLALLIAVPIISVFAGPSTALNLVPGSGAPATLSTVQGTVTIGSGTDNIGTNLIACALYPGANVNFTKTNIQMQTGGTPMVTQSVAYSESLSLVALRALSVAFVYMFAFLFIAWIAFKRAQVLE